MNTKNTNPDWADRLHPETIAIRAGIHRTQEQEHSEAIFPTSSFVFDSAEEAADRFAGRVPGNIYARFTNPTVRTFEERLAALEGAEACVATASGMAACLTAFMGTLKAGDHVVASRSIFGTTVQLLGNILSRFGVETSFVPLADVPAWRAALRPNTRMLFLETPSNPLTEIGDIQALADLAHGHDAWLVVDNCFCTPALQQPLKFGADLVIHSATKYLDGQGRTLGGAVCGSTELLNSGPRNFVRTAGPSLSPFNAWVQLKGLETLGLRMERHCANARKIAEWLEARPEVARVYYPGLDSHPQQALAARQQRLPGAILSFDLHGGQKAAWAFVDALRLLSLTANLGDAKTTITHPASTTHSRVSPEARAAAGVGDGLLRISVGLEHVDDLREDMERGFAALVAR
ncbi:MAG: O-succinylhomoserine sulfhydrylase [Acidithiobacillus sp.]|jgi:O-succinylhomoserine sulfhydrylase|uniref:O-succinylhomoserine sulfhydrylase n=2 Tax=Acidithiobacillus sp. TaxID=1872118 RepID=UPI003560D20A